MTVDNMSAGTTIDVHVTKEEVDSLGIVTIDRVDPSNALHVIKRDITDYPYKDRTDLKFCTHCGVGDHSLEDCPTMLEKINTKKNVNVLSCVQKMM